MSASDHKPKKSGKADTPASKAAAPAATVPVGAERFYNRELSWLQFNRRVIEEAQNKNHPVLERLRFLSISAANLDEFYMVRAAGVHGQMAAGVNIKSQDGLTPAQQMAAINGAVVRLVADQQLCWTDLCQEMGKKGLTLVNETDLRARERQWLEREFLTHIFPVLTPIAIDPAAANVTATLDLAAVKIPAGTHAIYFSAQTKGKFRDKPDTITVVHTPPIRILVK